MSFKHFTIDFQELAKEKSFRYDVDFVNFQNEFLAERFYTFNDLFEFSHENKVDVEKLDDDFFYAEIGDVSKNGEVEPVKLNFSERKEEEENYYKKIEKGDIIRVAENDILLSKVRPNLKKYVFIDEENKNYFYTSAFVHLSPKRLNKILFYSFRTIFYKNLIAISRQGKGYPTLKEDDFTYLKFDKKIIDTFANKQDEIVAEIEPIEKKIKELKGKITPPQQVINKVFAREFGFDLEKVYATERQKYFFVSETLAQKNSNIRSGVRWHKIFPIQNILYKNIRCIRKLGRYITETKNGWSPNCKEVDTINFVFGVNSISKDGVINFVDLKVSDETRNGIKNYFAKKGDLFVSRGNTVDLVALASVVENIPDEKDIIFPDLFIRIDTDEKELNKKYLAYLFNSVIGRLYFKYAAKGKNQTMVKISADELNNFYLPIPSLKIQQKIVDEIKAELDTQEEMNRKIESERAKIDEIIEKAVQ
jgi:type I restriction enzyme S subunit